MGGAKVKFRFNFVDFGSICGNCTENCCKRFYAVLLPEEEVEFSGSSFEIPTRMGYVRAIGARDGKPCLYLDEEGRCSIYRDRPLDCRLWPVMVYYDFSTGEKVVYLDLDCPAAAEGRIPRELVDRLVEELRRLEIDEDWLKKYTLAPWPNHLMELCRLKL